jgi:NADH-quinone oxidoreductase subunit J
MTPSMLFFIVIGAVSLASAVGVVSSRVPIHSALFLLTNFASLAVLYITLDAQFLAAAQIIIYAGGIVILILFVIMLIGSEQIETRAGHRTWTPFVGILLWIILIAGLIYAIAGANTPTPEVAGVVQGGIPEALGIELFSRYILPFELAAVLLLVALLGALLVARHPKTGANTQA